MDQQKIGQFLKSLRNEKKLTQEQLAEQFGVSSRTVSRWETGRNLPDISLLVEIADFYDVDVREIMEGERKSKMMDEQMHDVATKMADYADQEKSTLLKFIQIISFAGVAVCFVAIILQVLAYEPDLRRFGAILATLVGMAVLSIISLYVTGILQRIVQNKKLFTAIKITTIVLAGIATTYALLGIVTVGVLYASMKSAKIEVSNDTGEYNTYLHNAGSDKYGVCASERFAIFPVAITSDMQVKEFQFMYYNPFDPQYITYLTAEYAPDDYDAELARLKGIGTEEYLGIYTVTGEPAGYDVVAMDSDEHSGFVYALIPEGENPAGEITYVGIDFCNYFLDVDINNYLPGKYLLSGFDATENNPYRESELKKYGPLW